MGLYIWRFISIWASFTHANNSTVDDNPADDRRRSGRLFDHRIHVLGSLLQKDWVGKVSSSVEHSVDRSHIHVQN